MNLPSVSFDPVDPVLFPPNIAKLPRTPKRLTQLLCKGSANTAVGAQKSWSLDFLLSPKSFNSSEAAPDSLASMTLAENTYGNPDTFDLSALVSPTGRHISLPTTLAFRSIGYKSEPLVGMKDLGIDFDKRRGIIPNDTHGRITSLSPDGTGVPGMYCSGWVKRGPAGVIANTMEDAFGTAEAIAQDWGTNQPFMTGSGGWDALKAEAERKGLRKVDWADWKKIDAAEKKRGELRGKEREKFASVREMLNILD